MHDTSFFSPLYGLDFRQVVEYLFKTFEAVLDEGFVEGVTEGNLEVGETNWKPVKQNPSCFLFPPQISMKILNPNTT